MKAVAIIGLGYVGLPLACICAGKGYKVMGFDLDAEKVALINAGKSPIKDAFVEKRLGALKGKIRASTVAKEALEKADVAIICVPTPAINDKPDLSFVKSACESLAPFVSKKELVILESTVYPGTVEEIVKPILEKGSGLEAEKDFFLGHCPERIDPGNKKFTIENIPRVIACLSVPGTEKAKKFYESIIDAKVTVLGSVKAAEAVKVVENTFRDINIAYVNELAKSFDSMGIDFSEVIKGASTKPFGFMPFYPGPGVGGHCIAQDPYYLIARSESFGFEPKFLKLARQINESMPSYTVSLVESMLGKSGIQARGAKIALLGLSYKPDIDDSRESPALKILALLKERGADVRAFDPFVKKKSNAASLEEAIKGCDCVVLATHHGQFIEKLSPPMLKKLGVKIVVDARNVLDKEGILKQGIAYKGIGR
ncbi:MAG: nucleotide sugar dehydrogenase [archaeon]